jgi:hypothetical protein
MLAGRLVRPQLLPCVARSFFRHAAVVSRAMSASHLPNPELEGCKALVAGTIEDQAGSALGRSGFSHSGLSQICHLISPSLAAAISAGDIPWQRKRFAVTHDMTGGGGTMNGASKHLMYKNIPEVLFHLRNHLGCSTGKFCGRSLGSSLKDADVFDEPEIAQEADATEQQDSSLSRTLYVVIREEVNTVGRRGGEERREIFQVARCQNTWHA